VKSHFRGYYPPSDEELEKLWNEGWIVLDTNALLNLFRYSESTRDQLLELLRKEKDRLWLPHQIGFELLRNRRSIPHQQQKAFDAVAKAVEDAGTSIEREIQSLKRHPSVEAEALSQLVQKHMRKLSKGVRKATAAHKSAVLNDDAHEATFQEISELYDGHVGEPFDDETLKQIEREGKDRYDRKIPPGFEDAGKADNQYGDLILWHQILKHGKETELPTIFVTDDEKPDWWERVGGRRYGPRPELIEEYYSHTSERIHFYTSRRYLALAKERGASITEETLEETKKVSTVRDFKALNSEKLKATDFLIRLMAEQEQTRSGLTARLVALNDEIERVSSSPALQAIRGYDADLAKVRDRLGRNAFAQESFRIARDNAIAQIAREEQERRAGLQHRNETRNEFNDDSANGSASDDDEGQDG
jgi:hypothetical protein